MKDRKSTKPQHHPAIQIEKLNNQSGGSMIWVSPDAYRGGKLEVVLWKEEAGPVPVFKGNAYTANPELKRDFDDMPQMELYPEKKEIITVVYKGEGTARLCVGVFHPLRFFGNRYDIILYFGAQIDTRNHWELKPFLAQAEDWHPSAFPEKTYQEK